MSRAVSVLAKKRGMQIAAGVLLGALTLLALAPGARSQSAEKIDENGAPHVAGELIVTYEPGYSAAPVEGAAQEAGGEIEEEIPELNARLVELPEVKAKSSEAEREQLLAQKKKELEQAPAVESVQYNYVYKGAAVPNDPRYGEQWGLQKIKAARAWDKVKGNNVQVGVVDSGIDRDHPDLRAKIVKQRNFVGQNTGPAEDDNGHGTHVAGIAAAITGNNEGVAGTCRNCGLLIAKALSGPGPSGNALDIAEGIVWATNNGAEVINLSLAGEEKSPVLKDAIDYAAARDVVVVAAAGNSGGNTVTYPAAYPKVIAVAATTKEDRRAGYSNYGRWVDVAAPGGRAGSNPGILSTYLAGGYDYLAGTSMAAAHVAGLAGLLAAQGRSAPEIRKRIEKTAVDLGPQGKDRFFGYGRINAARAVGLNRKPRITNRRPEPGAKIKNRRPRIGATVRDDDAIDRAVLLVDGRRREVLDSGGKTVRLTYTPPRKLSPGRHSVKVIARDGRGRTATEKWSFSIVVKKKKSPRRAPLDMTAPDWPFNFMPSGYPFNVIPRQEKIR